MNVGLTMHDRQDLGDLEHLLQILRPEVGNAERNASERPVSYERFECLPVFADLAIFHDSRVVDEQQIGLEP